MRLEIRSCRARGAIVGVAAAIVACTPPQLPVNYAFGDVAIMTRDTIPPDVIARGKKVFEGQGGALCTTCHGMDARGVPGIGPNLTDARWLHGDGEMAFLQAVIRSGVFRAKESAAVMPPMGGAQLDAEQLRAVAAYVYSLSRAQPK